MRPIKFSKRFLKHYKQRIVRQKKLSKAFDRRYLQFAKGERGYPLNNHALTGGLSGKRAFSIAADIRVIYVETPTDTIFLDIGTHNQIY
jgi:mRNA-degrading endonuclease YafQ of YafQ-DinJ toxin-antitoxin module